MENLKAVLKNLLQTSYAKNSLFQRNILKDYLQILILDFIYSHPEYSHLVFYGGSCLAHCHQLPRLSEDLDFVDVDGRISLAKLASDLTEYARKNFDLKVKVNQQKFRLYVKFPILHDLNLTKSSETDLLFLKIEIFSRFGFCHGYKIENLPLFKYNKSILIKTFDLPTLMSTKIRALLLRKWEKTDKSGQVLIKAKGRDYYDLLWYLQKNVQPNLACLPEVGGMSELKSELLHVVQRVDDGSIRLDLEALINKPEFVKKISKGLKEILINEIERKF